MLRWLDGKMYVYLGKFSYVRMFTSFVNHMLKCLLALMITSSYVHILWCSHNLIMTCYDDCMLLFLLDLTITYTYVVCPHAYMFERFNDHMLTHRCACCYMLVACLDHHDFEWYHLVFIIEFSKRVGSTKKILFGLVFGWCCHHSKLKNLSDGWWKLKTEFWCFLFLKYELWWQKVSYVTKQ